MSGIYDFFFTYLTQLVTVLKIHMCVEGDIFLTKMKRRIMCILVEQI